MNRPGHELDPTAAERFTSAHATLAELRRSCPVAHSDTWGGFWALLRHGDVVDVLKHPRTYITSRQNVVPKVAFTGRRPPLHLDPPEHTPYRQVINRVVRPDRIARLEPGIRSATARLLRPLVDAGGGDICAEFAQRFPGHVLADFLNVPTDLAVAIREVTAVYNRALQEGRDEQVKETSLRLYDIARRMIAARRSDPLPPDEDLISGLLAKGWQGEPLPEELILGTVRQMIVVGMIAPSVLIGTMVVHLAEHPELQRRLRDDPGLVPAALEEYLRLYTPYRGFARTATADVALGGRTIPKDEPIALVYASANRDEEVFPDGDRFVLHRPNIGEHVAFGLGPHRCAGESLARLMLRVALEELLGTTSSIELDGGVVMTRWPEWGTLSVPVRLGARDVGKAFGRS